MAADQPRYLSQDVDYLGFLEAQLRGLRGIATLVYELVQNADDVKDEQGRPGAKQIIFDIQDDALIVENDGVFREIDFQRMQTVASGGKRDEAGTTGAFGIGFIAVYQVTDHPEILSSGRHWVIRPEVSHDKRIEERDVQTVGTRFRLPWASDSQSEVRRRLRLESVRPEQLPLFEAEIGKALSLAALFLKQIESLELRRAGEPVSCIRRKVEGDEILIQDGDKVLIWRILRGSFQEDADRLRKKYNWIESKWSSDVLVAIPDELLDSGHLFVVLPTETTTPLPFHINADFFPTSDRKRIIFGEDYQAEWNRAAIRAAACALAHGFDELPGLLHHEGLWKLIKSLDDCRRQAEEGKLDHAFSTFWEEVAPSLRIRRIIFTGKGEWIASPQARLLESDAELQASPIIQGLGIHAVHPELRPYFGLMRQKEIGVPLLGVQDIVGALKGVGLDRRVALSQAPACLRTVKDWQAFWSALDALLERQRDQGGLKQSEDALRSCAIAIDTTEELCLPSELYRGDADTRALFAGVRWMAEHGDPAKIPSRLVPEFGATDAVEFLSTRPSGDLEDAWRRGELDIETLYRWFEERKSEVLRAPDVKNRLRALPIWPASGSLRPLSDLYIPGGFDDPLHLSTLVDLRALGGRREFLKELGVQELTFDTYVREQIPRVFSERPALPAEAREQLVQLLAQRLGELRSSKDLRGCLQQLPLVQCVDGGFRLPKEVYLRSDAVSLLGDGVHAAKTPSQNADVVQALYEWLGVASEPRPEHVLQRINELTQRPPDSASCDAIESVFDYLVSRWSQWDESVRRQYDRLRSVAWLPGDDGSNRWYQPNNLYAVFRKYLFETQAVFLDFPTKLQNQAGGAGGLFEFLGVQTEPTPSLVVRHLVFCCERGQQVNNEVYRFLNDHADDPAVDQLRGKACLLLPDGYYVRPDQVYWAEHPFGPFRYRLGPDLRQYNRLFDHLGVREKPTERDFIQVLLEISQQYGQRHTPFDEQVHAVVMRCWEELDAALGAETITQGDLDVLRGKEVIPDPRRILAKPDRVYFEDRAGLADKFGDFLKNNVIARPQGAWRAMEAVGVRLLSQAVQIHLLECEEPTEDQELSECVKQRRQLIARVVESEKASGVEGLDVAALERLKFQQVHQLMIQYSLSVFNRTVPTKPEDVPALLKADERTLFTVHNNGRIPWPAVARELAYAIKPLGEIGGLAGGIKEVLASRSLEEARRTLDELGYPPLQERVETEVADTGVVSWLGGEELTADEAVAGILGGEGEKRTRMPLSTFETPPSGIPASGQIDEKKARKHQERLRTYVVGEGAETEGEPDAAAAAHRSDIDRAGIQRVLEYERGQGRIPVEQEHFHAGYDIESRDAKGHERYIEVKSLSGDWGARNAAGLTRAQFEFAREKGDAFWLYVVERATGNDYRIYCIQNPANRVNQYLFDDGWQALAEDA